LASAWEFLYLLLHTQTSGPDLLRAVMTQPTASHIDCPVVVLTINLTQVVGDDLADEIRDQMLAVAVPSRAKNVVLDFHKVTFLSSSGFRPLLSLHRLLRQQGGKLVLCGLTPAVTEIFEVTRLISTRGQGKAPFEVHPDVRSAVASLF
jgi:stage II sporulation protein AA (anti-sigma F factor antagonist)